MLTLLNKPTDDAVSISLISRPDNKALRDDAVFAPKKSGYTVFFNHKSVNPYAEAGRVCSNLGLKAIKLEQNGACLGFNEAYQFIMGFDDIYSELQVSIPVSDEVLEQVRDVYAVVTAARKLADTSNSEMTPVSLVRHAYELIKTNCNQGELAADFIDRDSDDFDDYAGLKAVGSGSLESPCLGIFDYLPEGMSEDSPVDIALVGKGITFDSGGYDLKPPKFMDTMRTDKTAAVNLAGALALACKLGLKKHVRLYLCCSQNLVSASSMVPGDIIEYQNGIRVEVGNTDAEGRLALADGLILASKSGASCILSEATLTGAAKIAVGRDMCALVCRGNDEALDLKEAFKQGKELLWQMPLFPFHDRFISSRRADLCNTSHGDGAPGVSTAAAFLEKFVRSDARFMHIDLSSAYLPEGSPFRTPCPTGATILSLALWLLGDK